MIQQAYLDRLAQVESGNNPLAKNPNSSAKGRFQFVDATAKQYGLDKYEFGTTEYEEAENEAVKQLSVDNYSTLKNALGREPTNGELYLAHQQGAGGAVKMLKSPNKNAVEVLGEEEVLNNGGNAEMTAGDFAAQWTDKFAELDEKARPIATALEQSGFSKIEVLEELKRRGLSPPEAVREKLKSPVSEGASFSKEQLYAEIKARGLTSKLNAMKSQDNLEAYEKDLPPEPSLGQEIYKISLDRNNKIQQARARAEETGIPFAGVLPMTGNAAAFIGDVGFELVKTGAEAISPQMVEAIGDGVGWAVSKVMSTPPAQMVSRNYGEFKQTFPVLADNIEGGLSTAFFIYPTSKLAKVKDAPGTSATAAEQAAKKGEEIIKTTEANYKNGVRPPVRIDNTQRGIKRILKSSTKDYQTLLDELENSDILTIADVAGDEVQGLTRSLGKMDGAKNLIHGTLTKRSEEAVERVSEVLSRNISEVDAYFGNIEEMAKARSAAARPLYEKAKLEATNIQDPRLTKFLEDKRIKDAILKAKREYGVRLEAPENSLETLDGVKKVLYDLETSSKRSGSTELAKSYKNLRQEMVSVLDDNSPTYARARKVFEHPSKLIEAQENGIKFDRLSPEQIRMAVDKMSPDELEAFRIGVREKLQTIVDKTSDGADPARRIFGNTRKKEQLKAVFPDKTNYIEFEKRMSDEIAGFKTRNAILGGSRSDYNIAGDLDFIDSAADAARRGVIATLTDKALTAVSDAVKRKYNGINKKNAEAIAEILMDREKGIKALQELIKKETDMQQRAIIGQAVKNHAPITMMDGTE